MKKNTLITVIIIGIGVLIILNGTFYRLNEFEQCIITQFGKPIGGAITNPGLHLKTPFIQKLRKFEKRILIWDGDAKEIPTSDKKYIWLDATARWKIVDPLKFYQSVENETGILSRLDDIIDSASRDVVSAHRLTEVVRNSNDILKKQEKDALIQTGMLEEISVGRDSLRIMIMEKASELVPQYGIELIDVQIKRINYVKEVRQKVFERMISERQKIAAMYRSEGKGEKADIDGKRERELQRIQSEAYKKAQSIKGTADAKATKIYAESYGKDPEFYSFLKTLEIYRNTIGKNSKVILSTDSDIYKYLKKSSVK
ncbi:protease modulator HflC [bacterium]|nr:protease modulator HflC [bacterium]